MAEKEEIRECCGLDVAPIAETIKALGWELGLDFSHEDVCMTMVEMFHLIFHLKEQGGLTGTAIGMKMKGERFVLAFAAVTPLGLGVMVKSAQLMQEVLEREQTESGNNTVH